MEQLKLKKETFDKITNYKKEHPDCKNLDDALATMLLDLENEAKIQKEEMLRFQNGLHDKNHQLDKLQKQINELIEAGQHGTKEQNTEIERLNAIVSDQHKKIESIVAERNNFEEQLRKHIGENDSLNEQIQALQNSDGLELTSYQLKIDKLTEENETLKATLQAYENTESGFGIQLLDPTQKILELVSQKLSKRYNQNVTPSDIVNKMILRYNVERWTAWFYPFVINDQEIFEITGKTTAELKQFFNSK